MRLRVCCPLLEGRGGWTFKNVFEALFPCLSKEKTGTLFTEKSLHGKFQQILSNLENRYEFVTCRILRTPSIQVSININWKADSTKKSFIGYLISLVD